MDAHTCMQQGSQVFMQTYAQFPLVLTGGKGCTVVDSEGRSYLDMVAGIAVNALGYGDAELSKRLCSVVESGLLHCSNLYWNDIAVSAATRLVRLGKMDRVFFCNSGTEANEAAVKLVRKAGRMHSPSCTDIVTMEHSFHGRTYASMTATGQPKYQASFHPLVPGFSYAPFNDLEGVKARVTDNTCAVFVEPVQGEGGVIPANKAFLEGLRTLCDERGMLLVYDEVQCGMGRTGQAFAWQYYGVKPDVVTMAKALGAGVPIGALAACGEAARVLAPGDHAATFGGNFLAAAAADVLLSRLEEGSLLEHVREASQHLSASLHALKKEFSCVKDVRGVGLMMGMELTVPVRPLIESCMHDGLLIVNAGPNILRFVPPLVISLEEIDAAMAIVRKALAAVVV